MVDALIFKSYIEIGASVSSQIWIGITTKIERIMTANSSDVRSVFLHLRRFRLVDVDAFIASQVTERDAPHVRIEGPDIALSGRQILLKLLT